MTLLARRSILALLVAVPALARGQTTEKITFHFYGARNCPPCIAFKRDGLPVVQAAGQQAGFDVIENLIDRTEDIDQLGIYGESDALLREAGLQMNRIYPPIFFVTQGDRIVSVHGPRWEDALMAAQSAVSEA